MSFLQQNWPWLLFVGVMIYMHFFMHRGHGAHGSHHAHRPDPEADSRPPDGPAKVAPQDDHRRHGGC